MRRHHVIVLLLPLITASGVQSFEAFSSIAQKQPRRILASPRCCAKQQHRHHLLSLRPAAHQRHESLVVSSSSALQSNNHNDDNGRKKSETIDVLDAMNDAIDDVTDGVWLFLSRPLKLGNVQIPSVYPLGLALVLTYSKSPTTLFLFTGVFLVLALIFRRFSDEDSKLLQEAFAVGLAMEATGDRGKDIVVLLVCLLLLGMLLDSVFSVSSGYEAYRAHRSEKRVAHRTDYDHDPSTATSNLPDKLLMDVWDEAFDQDHKQES